MSYLEFGTGNISLGSFTFGGLFIAHLSLLFLHLCRWQCRHKLLPVHHAKDWFVNIYINDLLPPIFNDWFTFVSVQHSYQTSSSTKEKLFKPLFNTIYGKNSDIASSIQSWDHIQQRLGSLKSLSSAKIRQLITNEVVKSY